jgi:tRNA-specific 2-thiouridylase
LSRSAHGIEVDLVAGEEGVSPGQACVFYDAPEGQARVLGGGIIQSASVGTELVPVAESRVTGRVQGSSVT